MLVDLLLSSGQGGMKIQLRNSVALPLVRFNSSFLFNASKLLIIIASLICFFTSTQGDSSLYCSQNLRYCTATNLYIDFRRFRQFASRNGRDRFLENILRQGEIGGHCKLYSKVLASQGEHKSPLQSWWVHGWTWSSHCGWVYRWDGSHVGHELCYRTGTDCVCAV